jgi:hypothetical protein
LNVTDDVLVAALRTAVEAVGGRLLRVDNDDCAHVMLGPVSGRIYLDNLRRRVAAGEPLPEAAQHFAHAFVSSPAEPTDATARRAGLRLLLEQREVLDTTSVVHRAVSSELACALAWTDPHEAKVTLVASETLARWSLGEGDAWDEAGRRMDVLLAETPIEVHQVAGGRLAVLATASVFKASLIAAPSLRPFVEPVLGWPVLAVLPCRDFAYLLPQDAHDLLGRLGGVVTCEFGASPYPLSLEAFLISDGGIQAIGSFRDN